jgi:hypothetical protein
MQYWLLAISLLLSGALAEANATTHDYVGSQMTVTPTGSFFHPAFQASLDRLTFDFHTSQYTGALNRVL